MKLRLFALRDLSTRRLLPDLFFTNKVDAKLKRDFLALDGVATCVTRGPDHYRG